MPMIRHPTTRILTLICTTLIFGCTSELTDPEVEIRQFLETGETAVEARELVAVANMISEQYGDPSGRSRRDLVRLVAGYILRNESVHLLTRIDNIVIGDDDSANARVYAGMAGKSVGGGTPISDLRADLYRFDLALAKESGDWKLTRAEWRRAEQQDLLDGVFR